MQNWYRSVVALDRNQHAGLKLASAPDFSFVATDVSVPLCIEELGLAAPFYPIVFTEGEQTLPMAITGLRRDQNLFVDKTGAWASGVYVPASTRNYPFVVVDLGEGREFVGVDAQSNLLGADKDERLFANGAQTELCKSRVALCVAYRESMRKTLEFGAALREAGLLDVRQAQVALPGGDEKLRLDGFTAVNLERLDKLSDETFLHWRKQGWLTPLYHHLASVSQWQRLLALAAAEGRATDESVVAEPAAAEAESAMAD